ncbi:SAM-dependent methyltransferase [Dactylosporangium sp. NPDC048998]|uniref:SAM-dependent methyltransferase n=1 Tax=Dactylosporangium sp. NPDC048998 TaxID=3363976 RepID=UPI0037144023
MISSSTPPSPSNFAVDRQVVQMLLQVAPEAPTTAKTNRAFGKRAVRYIAQQGVRQFIELGSGIPTTPPAVHETVRAVQPDARVVYVDFDPVVVAHSNALRSIGPGLSTVLADIRRPQDILSHPDLMREIDFDQPVGVVIFSVLDVIDDSYDPFRIMAQFRDRMAPGSYLGLSHLSERSAQNAREHSHMISKQTGFPEVQFRPDAEVLRFFDGFDLVEPGLVDVTEWYPEEAPPEMSIKLVGAVGRKS